MNRLAQLVILGQSLWLDNIRRADLENGNTRGLIERGDIRGMTSNPTIFKQAIAGSHDYDEALRSLAWAGWDAEKIFWELAVEDVRQALDLFAPLYEQTNGGDGYVSIEVSPHLAADTEATVAQAEQLWARVARPNLMVKIPATSAGIPAIRKTVAAGLNINITLIFSRRRYAQVMEAYLGGLEDRIQAGRPIDYMSSVASFFVSRVDSKVDKLLPAGSPLRGRAGIANAKLAYEDFLHTFQGKRWERIRQHGGRLQRPLWASTSTKDPAYPDTMYVDQLVGADTINTVPPQTLDAARDHARAELTISQDLDGARDLMLQLERAGISMDQVTSELETEGIEIFSASIDDLLKTIESRRVDAARMLGPLAAETAQRIDRLAADSFLDRFCAKDPTLWSDEPAAQAEISRRMGWLDLPQTARKRLPQYQAFAQEVRGQGISRFLVLGMGGSSLAAEVFSKVFSPADVAGVKEAVHLGILDATDPAQVSQAAVDFPPDRSLYIVSSKSGGTAEVTACLDYFWALTDADGSRFVAITDEGTSLEQLARKLNFRRVFLAEPTVGGRYSALTDFGLVPAALLGLDLEALLDRAQYMRSQCSRETPAARSPGIALGAVLAEAAMAGRDKLTIIADPALNGLPNWIEQLIAESSGKQGKGILPVSQEPLDAPSVYGPDRIFAYIRQGGENDAGIQALEGAGFPVLTFDVADRYDIGAEFFRWEVATAVACHILGVNAFDQPNVQESKDRTNARIQDYRSQHRLAEGNWDISIGRGTSVRDVSAELQAFLGRRNPGDYVSINAYLPRRQEIDDELQRIRVAIRERTQLAVTAGFGPRFQHSTGQFHKGGSNTGLFIQIVSDTPTDVQIPGQDMTFGTLLRAQALGDFETLRAHNRRVLRVHLSRPEDLLFLRKAFQ
ncbi:MAG TPA: bifunctional transaldolase/phosoglucose isomerase [Anaerolineales bacterium]